jgi:type II secretory pathway component HofQ
MLSDEARSCAALVTQLAQTQTELAHARAELASAREQMAATARLEEAGSAKPAWETQRLLSATMDLAARHLHNREMLDRHNAVLQARHRAADVSAQRLVAYLIGDGENSGCCRDAAALAHLTNWSMT